MDRYGERTARGAAGGRSGWNRGLAEDGLCWKGTWAARTVATRTDHDIKSAYIVVVVVVRYRGLPRVGGRLGA